MQIHGEKGFNGVIFTCIEKALQSLGEGVASAFFYQIETKFRLPKEEFASKPIELIKCLKELLGVSGSATIERLIVREIRTEFHLLASQSNATLEGAIAEAKKNFLTA